MNWFKRLFKREIKGEELKELILNLGGTQKDVDYLFHHESSGLLLDFTKGYTSNPSGVVDVKLKDRGALFELSLSQPYFRDTEVYASNEWHPGPSFTIETAIPYKELSKNPALKKYVKGKYLEKSLAVLSIASILASAFFISNNITGNAILTANANSSGIIGAGLFVFGLVCFFVARKI